jgi:hypothetical protein
MTPVNYSMVCLLTIYDHVLYSSIYMYVITNGRWGILYGGGYQVKNNMADYNLAFKHIIDVFRNNRANVIWQLGSTQSRI